MPSVRRAELPWHNTPPLREDAISGEEGRDAKEGQSIELDRMFYL